MEQIAQLAKLPAEHVRKLETEEKELWLRVRVEESKQSAGRGDDLFSTEPIILVIERKNIFRDSFEQFRTTQDLDLRQEIKINFVNEISQDAGGLIRDWFSTIIEELFSPERHLFKRANTKELAYVIDEYSGNYYSDHLEYYYFTGQVIAKALYERNPVKAYLSKLTLKMLLNLEVTVEDIKYCDEEMHKSLQFILDNPISDELGIGTFVCAKKDPTGKETVVELKENGKDVSINDNNKYEFCDLFFKAQFVSNTQNQTKSLIEGFTSLLPAKVVGVLDADELELLICGDTTIDIEDWKANTCYGEPFTKDHPVIVAFWYMVKQMSNADRERFLQFCTGSKKVPAEGFKGLRAANNKVNKFKINPRVTGNYSLGYIMAHTCFNTIELPVYNNFGMMKKNLYEVLKSPENFQFTIE
eukprot:TRINITY_DN855_c0_g4_i2.p1 TRINITY_DN855_c0_g4~~TRINITY_DN855_c0_g4_i2.p1  ORF type:complete len:415 (+),score=129.10 TRINITY_DN855_c0_g4_i2:531-1775(+)